MKSSSPGAQRRRRLWTWLRFLLANPRVLADASAVGAGALLLFWLLFKAAWALVLAPLSGSRLSAIVPLLLLPCALALFAALAACVGALCASAAARLQGRTLPPRELLALVARITPAAMPLMNRDDREQPGATFALPALACEGLDGGRALAVASDLQRAYAPLVAEIEGTWNEVVGWALLPVVLLGIGAGPLVMLAPSGADPYRWMLWHVGPVALAALAFALLIGFAVELGAVAAYLYATNGEEVRARVLPLLPDMRRDRVPPPSKHQQEVHELREALKVARQLSTPFGRFAFVAPFVALPFLLLLRFAPGVYSVPIRALGTPVEAQITHWSLSHGDCVVWYQFQATKDYAPDVSDRVNPGVCAGLAKYQKVRARYVRFHPDWAVLENDGGKLRFELVVLGLVALFVVAGMYVRPPARP